MQRPVVHAVGDGGAMARRMHGRILRDGRRADCCESEERRAAGLAQEDRRDDDDSDGAAQQPRTQRQRDGRRLAPPPLRRARSGAGGVSAAPWASAVAWTGARAPGNGSGGIRASLEVRHRRHSVEAVADRGLGARLERPRHALHASKEGDSCRRIGMIVYDIDFRRAY